MTLPLRMPLRMATLSRSHPEPRHRIAFVLAGLGAGGAERVVSLIAGTWARRGHDVCLIAFDSPDDGVFHAFDPAIRLIRLSILPRRGAIAGVATSMRRWWALRRTLARLTPDVTIAFLTKINVLTMLASLGTERRVIISERNNPRMQPSSRLWTALLAKVSRRADAIVMQTEASLTCLTPADRRRAHVIPNPIGVTTPSPRAEAMPTVAAVGRLTHQKGFDLLIQAFAMIADDHPHWTLMIWGDGPERGALQRQIDAAGLSERVTLPGNSLSPDHWLATASAFVLSSRYEGFSNVLGEAMAAGLPVVAFDCDFSPRELIDPDRTGLLVPKGDIRALADALDRVIADDRLRDRLGEAARQDSVRFEPDLIVAQWDALIDQVTTSA